MQSRAPFIFIFITLTLDAMGIGLILPVMPELIVQLRGGSVSDAAFWGGLLAFSFAGMQFLFAPLLGNLSDRYGRRPVLITSLALMAVNYALMAMATALWWLFAARLASGITGATHPTAAAYLADISDKDKRSANFGLVGAAFGIGFILGPAFGGLLGELGARAPFWAAGLLAAGNAIFGWIALPESLKPENRRRFDPKRANPVRAITRIRRLPVLGGLLQVDFLFIVSNNVYPAIWAYYMIERFDWSPGTVGLSLAAFGVASALMQGWLIRKILARLGERRTAMLGLVAHAASTVSLVLIPSGLWVFVLMPLLALGVIVGAALRGMMANRLEDDEQGDLQGVLASITGIGAIVSPLLMTLLFRAFTAPQAPVYLPGAPFLAASLLALAALALLRRETVSAERDAE